MCRASSENSNTLITTIFETNIQLGEHVYTVFADIEVEVNTDSMSIESFGFCGSIGVYVDIFEVFDAKGDSVSDRRIRRQIAPLLNHRVECESESIVSHCI
jgi:hypothetical protein